MDRRQFVRLRTDTVLSLVSNDQRDYDAYLKAFREYYKDADVLEKEDAAIMGMMQNIEPSIYSMSDIDTPAPIRTLNLPEGYDDYLAGQRRFSTTYAQDWPMAHEKNTYGKRHPFSYELPTMPLLHGAQWGEPAFVDHLLHLIEEDEEGQSIIKMMKESDRMGHHLPKEYQYLIGKPMESLHQLYRDDRTGRHSYKTDEEYIQSKKDEWNGKSNRLGLLSYLFGLEWQSPDQREAFMDNLKKLGSSRNLHDADARKAMNDFTAVAGISWDRAKRNWFERLLPVARWWQRPSNRHGPVSPEDIASPLGHFKGPYVTNEDIIEPSATHHWWQPFQHWGGVGRDANSLVDMMTDTYPAAFKGWLGEELVGFLNDRDHPLNDREDSFHGSGSTFFPQTANHPMMKGHPHRSAVATGWEAGSDNPYVRGFNRRRGLWSSVSGGHHLHPSQIQNGFGRRMVIPSVAFAQGMTLPAVEAGLGRKISAHTDQGQPRKPPYAERHPGDEEYHSYHNDHYERSDVLLGQMMQQMAKQVTKEFGPELLYGSDPNDIRGNTIARGNMQQLAQAANYQLMRGENPDMRSFAPTVMGEGLATQEKPLGPIHPNSHVTMPPVYLTGNKDVWGHKMPATLAWNWDRQNNSIRFDQKEMPFETLQRTAHAGHIGMVHPTYADSQIAPPADPNRSSLPAFQISDEQGAEPILSGDIWKSDDDYEATGVFKTTIVPAHTIYNLKSVEDLKGFTGDWVVQKKPEGKRLFIFKKGGHISACDGKGRDRSIPAKVREGVRKQEGDCVFDGVLKDGKFRAIDLLVHKGDDIHMEKLEDRLSILRTMYETDEAVSFPMPADCKFSDSDGLGQNVSALGGDLWLRDATSTFMKGKESHHKWVLFAPNGDHIGKAYGPFPSISIRNENIVLEYPAHPLPLVVKGKWDGAAYTVDNIEPSNPLAIHAETQASVWGPVAVHLLKYGMSQESIYPPFIPTAKSMFYKNAILDPAGDDSPNQNAVRVAREKLTQNDKAMTTEELLEQIDGLDEKTLHEQGPQFGLERTEDGLWTVNEAIDDDMIETKQGMPLARVSGSITGGGLNGMMDMLTAPRGPTELRDEEATPMFDPFQSNGTMAPDMPTHVKIQSTDEQGEEIEGELEVQGNRAVLRYPEKTKKETAEEAEVKVPIKEEEPPMPPPGPMPPQSG